MRGDSTIVDFSFRVLVRDVEPQHRLRIPNEFARLLAWLPEREEKIVAVGLIGPIGGMQIVPMESNLAKTRGRFQSKLNIVPAKIEETVSALVDATRYLATAWHVSFSYDPARSRYTLVLPEEARLLGIVPKEGEGAVIFATGEILEIWPATAWVGHVRKIGLEIPKYIDQALTDLDDRQ